MALAGLSSMRSPADGLPAGPRLPRAHQTLGWWYRPVPMMERCRARYGDRFTLRLIGMPPVVVLSGAEDVRAVLTADPDVLRPGAGAEVLEPIVGSRSIALMDGKEHLAERRLILPALHGERVRALAGAMEQVAAAEIAAWPTDEPVSIHPRVLELSLTIVMRTMLGLAPGDVREGPLRAAIEATLTWSSRLPNLVPRTRRSLLGRGPWARFRAARDEADRLLRKLAADRQARGVDGDDVLGSLLSGRYEDGTAMSEQQISDELMTLVAGGHESIALALAWTCGWLAQDQPALARLTAEVDAGTEERYLIATIQEALRRRPILPVFPRLVAEDATVGAHRYPRGTLLQVDAYLVHHNPAIYTDPYAFRPERFIEQSPGTYTWVPFGGGRRRCVGAAFAQLEMATILRTLLRTRRIAPADGVEPTRRHNLALAPAHGTSVHLPRRAADSALSFGVMNL